MNLTPDECRMLLSAVRCYARSSASDETPTSTLNAIIARLRGAHTTADLPRLLDQGAELTTLPAAGDVWWVDDKDEIRDENRLRVDPHQALRRLREAQVALAGLVQDISEVLERNNNDSKGGEKWWDETVTSGLHHRRLAAVALGKE